MKNLLKIICENKEKEIIESKKRCSMKSLEKLIQKKNKRGFKNLAVISEKNKCNNIIGEIKKGSPSAGIILEDYFPEDIAINYEKSGIGSISILTDKKFFFGSLDNLSLVSKNTNIPILRKDFIIDPYQILESKVYNADAILLIASILDDQKIKEFVKIANEYDLDCILEIHDEDELKRVIKFGYPIIGINNRNLKNLKTDLTNTFNLINKIPNEFTVISESGIKNKEDIDKFNYVGIFNFLIGESILKSKDFSSKIKSLANK